MKTVGIIGGLGPETTSEFYLDVVFSCQKKDGTARPPIIISSVPLPYKIEEDLILRMGKFILNLVVGQQKNRDREELINIINDFGDKGLDCVILACTDLQLLIPHHPTLKIFDTMKVFVDATVQEIINN